MRPLGERLSAAGFPVLGVRLAGHATAVDDLARTGWRDWFGSVEAGFASLRARSPRVAVIGLSTGALLSVRLAAAHGPAVSALVLCATALELRDPRLRLLPWLSRLPAMRRRLALLPKHGRDITDPVARAASRAYEWIPLGALLDLFALQALVRADLPAIHQPTLVVHGARDRTVPLRSFTRLRRGLATPWLEAHMLPRSGHVITEDLERDDLGRLAGDFLARVERTPAGGAPP